MPKRKQRLLIWLCVTLIVSCNKNKKSHIEVAFKPDTLSVGYTYWWPESGPFVGMCGKELSFVALGILKELKAPSDDPGPLYTAQRGVVEIAQVLKIKDLGKNTYDSEQLLATDCFFGSGIAIGDTLLLTCYDYEGSYSIPGNQSLLKLAGYDDPVVRSIRRYIDADENPLAIADDIGLWTKHHLGRALERLVRSKQEAEEFPISIDTEE